jgi:hypothetical protein
MLTLTGISESMMELKKRIDHLGECL